MSAKHRDVSVKIDGLNKFRRALGKLDDEAVQDFKTAGFGAAGIVVREGKLQAPVRTGRLRDTIRAAKIQSGARVYAGKKATPYAGPIHFGWYSRKISPNPFLYRAADRRIGEVVDTYLDQIYRTWQRGLK